MRREDSLDSISSDHLRARRPGGRADRRSPERVAVASAGDLDGAVSRLESLRRQGKCELRELELLLGASVAPRRPRPTTPPRRGAYDFAQQDADDALPSQDADDVSHERAEAFRVAMGVARRRRPSPISIRSRGARTPERRSRPRLGVASAGRERASGSPSRVRLSVPSVRFRVTLDAAFRASQSKGGKGSTSWRRGGLVRRTRKQVGMTPDPLVQRAAAQARLQMCQGVAAAKEQLRKNLEEVAAAINLKQSPP